jgi:urea transporter
MALKLCSTGLVVEENSSYSFAGLLDVVLRGIGQVFLQNNSYAGLLFLIGIFYNSTLFGAAVLVGTIVSTLTAISFGANKSQIKAGLFGFNGALVGIALLYFLQPEGLTWAYVIFASACSTVVMASAIRLFDIWKMPTLTSPFVLTTLCFLLACARFGRLHSTQILPTAGLPMVITVVDGVVNFSTILEGLFKGIAQVFFQENAVTGGLFTLGLCISSRRAGTMAILGSLIGLIVAWGLGASGPAIRSGAFGFNSALTAIALGSTFLAFNTALVIYTMIAAVATVITSAALSAALQPLGMPALTLPFVVTAWLFFLGSSLFTKLRN